MRLASAGCCSSAAGLGTCWAAAGCSPPGSACSRPPRSRAALPPPGVAAGRAGGPGHRQRADRPRHAGADRDHLRGGPARNRAMSVPAAVDLIAGGWLTSYLSWRWVLFVNVPHRRRDRRRRAVRAGRVGPPPRPPRPGRRGSTRNTRFWMTECRARASRRTAQNGGYSRVGQEQEQSQKVKLSLDAMRPDRCSYVCQGSLLGSVSAVRRFAGVLGADKTGMSHSGCGGKALMRSRSAGLVVPRGRPADRSQASRCGSRISGQAAPGSMG